MFAILLSSSELLLQLLLLTVLELATLLALETILVDSLTTVDLTGALPLAQADGDRACFVGPAVDDDFATARVIGLDLNPNSSSMMSFLTAFNNGLCLLALPLSPCQELASEGALGLGGSSA